MTMGQIHIVKVIWGGAKMTLHKTQAELADLLKTEGVELISVNASEPSYRRKTTRKGAKAKG